MLALHLQRAFDPAACRRLLERPHVTQCARCLHPTDRHSVVCCNRNRLSTLPTVVSVRVSAQPKHFDADYTAAGQYQLPPLAPLTIALRTRLLPPRAISPPLSFAMLMSAVYGMVPHAQVSSVDGRVACVLDCRCCLDGKTPDHTGHHRRARQHHDTRHSIVRDTRRGTRCWPSVCRCHQPVGLKLRFPS